MIHYCLEEVDSKEGSLENNLIELNLLDEQ